MKINKLSKLGMFGGLVLMISSWIRYYILFPDFDRAISFPIIGALIIAVSFLWDRQVKLDNKVNAVQEYLADNSKGGKTYGK